MKRDDQEGLFSHVMTSGFPRKRTQVEDGRLEKLVEETEAERPRWKALKKGLQNGPCCQARKKVLEATEWTGSGFDWDPP